MTRVIEHLYLSTEGIWGVPLGVSADFVYLFVLFGAVLDVAGGGALLIALANKVAGRTRGGPAKTAAVASALMGSLSGSAVANVVTTGTFTIPLMKRAGFKPYFAAAIESAASTGGQLMPPVMGAGAFIMATWTNIAYLDVALAATIPAFLYYAALLSAIHFRAGFMGIQPDKEPNKEKVIDRLHLLLPLVIIVLCSAMGRSPMRAAFWGVASAFIMALLRPATRPSKTEMVEIMERAGQGAVQVAAACAAAGIVVGVASLTGIGLRMSELIITLSGGNLLIALMLTGARLDRPRDGSSDDRRLRGPGGTGRSGARAARRAALGGPHVHLLLRLHLERDPAGVARGVRRRGHRRVRSAHANRVRGRHAGGRASSSRSCSSTGPSCS
jgi:TRAP transporter 4TM/12TM fusion protein